MAGIEVYNRAEADWLDFGRIAAVAEAALGEVLTLEPATREAPLAGLEEVEVSLVDDAVIAEVHRRFMQIPGPTDVITFEHGEIVLSVETAAASAEEHGVDRNREVALYIVHGLLHLHGFDDLGEEARRAMGRVQDEILGRLWG